jgi:urease beta subunit
VSNSIAGPANSDEGIGSVRHPAGDIRLAEGRQRIRLTVTNTSTRAVRISSHYPFWRVNPRLSFDRRAAKGFRLDVPAGTSVLWSPGQVREVELVAYGGSVGEAVPL